MYPLTDPIQGRGSGFEALVLSRTRWHAGRLLTRSGKWGFGASRRRPCANGYDIVVRRLGASKDAILEMFSRPMLARKDWHSLRSHALGALATLTNFGLEAQMGNAQDLGNLKQR